MSASRCVLCSGSFTEGLLEVRFRSVCVLENVFTCAGVNSDETMGVESGNRLHWRDLGALGWIRCTFLMGWDILTPPVPTSLTLPFADQNQPITADLDDTPMGPATWPLTKPGGFPTSPGPLLSLQNYTSKELGLITSQLRTWGDKKREGEQGAPQMLQSRPSLAVSLGNVLIPSRLHFHELQRFWNHSPEGCQVT